MDIPGFSIRVFFLRIRFEAVQRNNTNYTGEPQRYPLSFGSFEGQFTYRFPTYFCENRAVPCDITFNFHYLISLVAMDTFVENHVDLLVSANFLLRSERYTDLDPSFFMPTMVG